MSWLMLDDRILDHPKFIRAVKLGGSEALHLWVGLRAYCGQFMTDGFIPADMLDEVKGPRDPDRRRVALTALTDSGLLDTAEGGMRLHDYLDWSPSREAIIEKREGAKERQRRSRENRNSSRVTDASPPNVTSPSVTAPYPIRSDPIRTDPNLRAGDPTVEQRDPDPAGAPARALPARSNGHAVWGASDWLKHFGNAWAEKYGQIAYGQSGDSRACATLGDTLRALPEPELLAAQAKASAMFAEFLGSGDPMVVKRRHPFAFFVGEWGGLRVSPVEAAPSKFEPAAVRAERERQERIDDARVERALGMITPKRKIMSPQERIAEIESRTNGKPK